MDNVCVACEPTEPKLTRIMAIYDQLQTLGREVIELQKDVNSKRVEYYAIEAKDCEEEKRPGGIINNIEWMIGDIKRMVLDIREYVEIL
jgi:hypothetical protein